MVMLVMLYSSSSPSPVLLILLVSELRVVFVEIIITLVMLSSSCSSALLVLLVNELMMVLIVWIQVALVLFLLILNEQLKAGWKMAAAETILCRRSLVLGSFEV